MQISMKVARTLPVAVAALASLSPLVAAPVLRLEVRARAVAPGEPVRLVAQSAEPLHDVHGTFLGRPVAFVPDGERRWSGWGVVPLDAKAGPGEAAVSGTDDAGADVAARRDVRVQKKTFPSERLQVSKEYVEPPPDVAERIKAEQQLTKAVYARRTPLPPADAPFVKPVPGDASATFGTRRFFNGEPRAPHAGLDLRAAAGTPVASAGPGVVAVAQDLYFSGGTVIVDHGGGLFTIYAHLSRIDVKPGERVTAGQVLGLSGATGRVTGPHLHWGARVGDAIFDPRALLDTRLWK